MRAELNQRHSYRPDIDGLRALAVLIVVACHAGLSTFSGGFVGVDVFFVISGYLITTLLLNEAQRTGGVSLIGFFTRRAKRLLPALCAMLALILPLGSAFLPGFGEKQGLAASALASLGFVANEYFRKAAGGYFDTRAQLMPLLHLWSLSVEEQFYLIWPLLIIIAAKTGSGSRIRTALWSLVAVSFAWNLWLVRAESTAAFFTLPSRAWELGAGALLAAGYARRPGLRDLRAQGAVAGLSGLALILAATVFFDSSTPYPGIAAVVPVAGALLLVLAGCLSPGNPVSVLLSAKLPRRVGVLAYSWYLWHWPLLSLVRNRRMTESNVSIDMAVAAFALLPAYLSYRFVEEPIRRGTWTRRTLLKLAGGALGIVVTLAALVGAWAKYGPHSVYELMSSSEMPPQRDGCLADAAERPLIRPRCTEPATGLEAATLPLVVVWGDSHADAWAPAFRFLSAGRVVISEVSVPACPPLMGTRAACRNYNSELVASLKRLRDANFSRPVGVVLAARWPAYLGIFPIPLNDRAPAWPKSYIDGTGTVAGNLEEMQNGLRRSLSEMAALNVRVLVLLNGPEYSFPPLRCADLGHSEPSCVQSADTVAAYRDAAASGLRKVSKEFPEVRVADPLPFFCGAKNCPGFINGHPVTYDDSHISVSAATAFAPAIRSDFEWLTRRDDRAGAER